MTLEAARSFVRAMNDYFAESDYKRDAIAACQLKILGHYQDPNDGRLRLSDVKLMFEQHGDQA